jgi:diguanylate cyclase
MRMDLSGRRRDSGSGDRNGAVQRNTHADRDPAVSLERARAALEQIRALALPADPPSFEVWYTYVAGQNRELNQAIDDILQRDGAVSVADLDVIHDRFLSAAHLVKRAGSVGQDMGHEVDRVIGLVDAALRSGSGYAQSLSSVGKLLDEPADRDALRRMLVGLAAATRSAERENRNLRDGLKASRQQITQLQSKLRAVWAETSTDALTRISNRRHFDQELELRLLQARTTGTPLSLMLCDVDHFKAFNDTHGHLTGDHVLQLIAATINRNVGKGDLAARYGGEEFAVILPGATRANASIMAEKIRIAVMERPLLKRSTGARLGTVTVSIGVAELTPGDSAQSIIERADMCLYAAKRAGRNCINASEA